MVSSDLGTPAEGVLSLGAEFRGRPSVERREELFDTFVGKKHSKGGGNWRDVDRFKKAFKNTEGKTKHERPDMNPRGNNGPARTSPGKSYRGKTSPGKTSPDKNIPGTKIPDTNIPDTNIPDTNIPDTNIPDTNIPDTNIPDTNPPPTKDTAEPDPVQDPDKDFQVYTDENPYQAGAPEKWLYTDKDGDGDADMHFYISSGYDLEVVNKVATDIEEASSGRLDISIVAEDNYTGEKPFEQAEADDPNGALFLVGVNVPGAAGTSSVGKNGSVRVGHNYLDSYDVIAHEALHNAGLGHVEDTDSVMYRYLIIKGELSQLDKEMLTTLYRDYKAVIDRP